MSTRWSQSKEVAYDFYPADKVKFGFENFWGG